MKAGTARMPVTSSDNWKRRLRVANDWPQLEASYTPAGCLGQPEDMAGLTVYLASDESSWVTGAVFPVDGGYLAV